MPLENLTKQAFGSIGANQIVGTVVATISNPGPGRYKIWGQGRHSVASGLCLKIGSIDVVTFAGAGGAIISMRPLVVDITNSTDNSILDIAYASGSSDKALATIYAQKVGSNESRDWSVVT